MCAGTFISLFIPLKGYVDTKRIMNRVCQEKPVLNITGDFTSIPWALQYLLFANHLAFENPLVAFVNGGYPVFSGVSDAVLMSRTVDVL